MISEVSTQTAEKSPGSTLESRYLVPAPVPRRAPLPRTVKALFLLLVAVITYLGGNLAYVVVGAEQDYATHADTIIVLGCQPWGPTGPSDCLTARANHAATLYKEGLASHIIASGGGTADGYPESPILAQVLEKAGVPQSAILEEDRSHDTIQNIQFSQQIMQAQGWTTAILVTEPYHIKRAALIAHDDNLRVYPSPAVDSPLWQDPTERDYLVLRDTLSLILYELKLVVGEKE